MASTPRYESETSDASRLAEPLQFVFSGKTAPNRFLKGAMSEREASWNPTNSSARGIPSPELVNLYKRWGEGGFGLILTGNVMVDPDHIEAAGNPVIPRDAPCHGERFDGFKELATQGKASGGLIVAQIGHPGRQVQDKIQPNPISASEVQLEGERMGMTFAKPRAATVEDIKTIIDSFAHTAEYLEKGGFDGVQLHGAHGYLLAQFLSPSTNLRTDAYGGSVQNRARLVVEIADEIRKRTKPDFVLGIKLNSVEFQDNGFSPDDARELCTILEEARFDFVELSGGTYESLAFEHKGESTRQREAFFIEFAEQITPVLKKTKTYITGGFKTVGAMVGALDVVNGVGLARTATQEPRLPKDIIEGKVTGAIRQKIEETNFGLTLVAAGTQIKQIGKDHEPIDLSKEENLNAMMKDLGPWTKIKAEDIGMNTYGYMDVTSATPTPYGTALA